MTTLEGIDAYEGQGYINWAEVRGASKRFGFVKATEGNYHEDFRFAHNWASVKYRGMVRGAYHYFIPSRDASDQVDYLHAMVRRNGHFLPGDFVWLDAEELDGTAPATVLERIIQFVLRARLTIAKQTGIYTNPNHWINELGNPTSSYLDQCPLWLADYGPSVPQLAQWPNGPSFWQYSDTGHCPGVAVECDLNRFYGSIHQLHQLARFP